MKKLRNFLNKIIGRLLRRSKCPVCQKYFKGGNILRFPEIDYRHDGLVTLKTTTVCKHCTLAASRSVVWFCKQHDIKIDFEIIEGRCVFVDVDSFE